MEAGNFSPDFKNSAACSPEDTELLVACRGQALHAMIKATVGSTVIDFHRRSYTKAQPDNPTSYQSRLQPHASNCLWRAHLHNQINRLGASRKG